MNDQETAKGVVNLAELTASLAQENTALKVRVAELEAQEACTDDKAVNNFAAAMREKMRLSREKGRSGWDDPDRCSVEHLAELLVSHLAKGDSVDIANFAMMLHQREADPSVLREAVERLREVKLPEIGSAYAWCNDLPPTASQLFSLRMFAHGDDGDFIWSPLAHAFVALLNEGRKV